MATRAELSAMRRAIGLARGPGTPLGPNPRVGAVILDRAGDIVAEASHQGLGTMHAEAAAVASAGARASGATVVVTLEPCNHTGRTGPCSRALVEAGVARVVYAQADLSPVARGGADALRAADVDVEGGVLAHEAEQTNVAWSFAQRHGRPYVTWKFAATLDGRSAAADGSSRWITGPEARADVHRMRAECDAVLVGTGTVLADDPRLTVRHPSGEPLPAQDQPLRVVMGQRQVPAESRIFDAAGPSLALRTRDPHAALAALAERGCRQLWLEGGPTLAAAFVDAGLVERVVAFVAPVLLGAGPPAVAELGITSIEKALRLVPTDVTRLGDDVRMTMEWSS